MMPLSKKSVTANAWVVVRVSMAAESGWQEGNTNGCQFFNRQTRRPGHLAGSECLLVGAVSAGHAGSPVAAANKDLGLAYATPGTGASIHFADLVFAQMSDLTLTQVPYSGNRPAITNPIGSGGGGGGAMFDHLPAPLPPHPGGSAARIGHGGSRARCIAARCADEGRGRVARPRGRALVRCVRPSPTGLPAPVLNKLSAPSAQAVAMLDVKKNP